MPAPALAEAGTEARDQALEQTSPQISPHSLTQQIRPADPPHQAPADGDPPKAAPKPGEAAPPRPGDDSAKRKAEEKRGEESLPKSRLVSILGREITNREGDSGRVIDVLVDLDGQSGAVVVEFGGFMGIGSRKVVVDWSAVRLVREGSRTQIVVDISREQIRDATEYKPGEPVGVVGK
jgi:hypothetical protein